MDNTPLSDREIEILKLVAQGKSNKEIAAELFISINTVKVHLGNVFQKINVSSRTEATLYAIEHNIIQSPGQTNGNIEILIPQASQTPELTRWQILWQRFWWAGLLLGFFLIIGLSTILAESPLLAEPTATLNPLGAALNQPGWRERNPIPQAVAGYAMAAYDQNIIIIAGENNGTPSRLIQNYDTKTDTWSMLSEKPTPVSEISAAVLGEKIYIPGGKTADGKFTNILEVYDPSKNSWETKAELPRALSGYALSAYEGQLYLFGGWDGQKALNNAFRYDPQNDTWQEITSLPTARAYAGVAEEGGKIFIIGGWDGEKALMVNESFSPARELAGENPWLNEVSLPEPSYDFGAVTVMDTLYKIGGKTNVGPANSYLFSDGAWTVLDFPQAFTTRTSAVSTDIYILFSQTPNEVASKFFSLPVVYNLYLPIVN